ncbi:4-hydroxy-tetrahydrodipicolinate synthase [Variovorax boronicumulans]|uniref:4-hydroxy-tetrahydrodipicolinate synthase n=1 Tax=Variovorax boronicumulans TaxID=436515 RepID=A0AAW8DTW5_9BURK|nr:4-hydroxy-tetrahydrodipicolinate synthase [Variovorax boronicumulans]MDP9877484.1 4-hydroxy-tetrahydrodipicolinate synthase [Variovorax boronicumulans]MDP9922769.1 4-hydroxy-tetrahydrodipicolinate synthase [Variovorax boronicumulans]
MNLSKFHGVVPAMATPFTADHRLDEARVGELIDSYIRAGVHGISVAGSQGEFFALERDEHIRLLELSMRAIDGRVPLYAGTGGATTRDAIALTQAAEALGADLALVITPYFVQPTQDELVAHYTAVARATKLPVMLYNNPPRTAVNVLPATLARCMQAADNIVGMKDSGGDLTQSIEYLLTTPRPALLFSGRDTIALSMMFHGAQGTISPAANVFPELMVRMYDALRAGRHDEALRVSNIFAPLRAAWAWGSFPVVIKEAMTLAGRSAGPTRPPVAALPEKVRADLRSVVERIGASA